jgi:S1-C subfamily serine protease
LSSTPAALFGFQDGDVLSSVNGDRITSEGQIMDLYEKYKNTRVFNVGIIRNGQPQNLSVDISKFIK